MMRVAAWVAVGCVFARELMLATWATIRAVVHPPGRLRPAIIAVPLDVTSAAGITLFADMVTLTPGTTSLEVSADGRTLFVHALDAPEPQRAIADMKGSLEAAAMRVLP